MQPAAWPVRDAQIIERQSELFGRMVADHAMAVARAAAAAPTEAQQGRCGPAAQAPRIRQIDLLTGEQWPAPQSDAPGFAARAANGPDQRRREVAVPPLPRIRTRMPPPSPAAEVGRAMRVPSWRTRPATAAPTGSPRSGAAPESPLDAAPGDYLCPIRCASSWYPCDGQPPRSSLFAGGGSISWECILSIASDRRVLVGAHLHVKN